MARWGIEGDSFVCQCIDVGGAGRDLAVDDVNSGAVTKKEIINTVAVDVTSGGNKVKIRERRAAVDGKAEQGSGVVAQVDA